MRHGVSLANDKDNPAYGSPSAGLLPRGKQQSMAAGEILRTEYNFDTTNNWVATSRMRRSQDSAISAGCMNIVFYGVLNEATEELSLDELLQIKPALAKNQVPTCAINRAAQLLESPPEEGLWVTHGLIIIGLCEVLGVRSPEWRFLPNFGEIRELPI
jgi:hypothetical protein